MVYYFKSVGAYGSYESDPRFIYMGKDKHENDELIRYGFEEDVWFHVDNLSSAHVYLRLQPGERWDQIPEELLIDCAQLTKANSIEGNKKNNVTIIYTPWSNLKRTKGMPEGQVSFKNPKTVRKIHVQSRDNSIINRLKKTREEIYGKQHLIESRDSRDSELLQKAVEAKRQRKLRDDEEKKHAAKQKKKQQTLYDDMWDDKEIEKTSNQKRMYDPEEDFW